MASKAEIRNWTVKSAGGKLTLNGVDVATGEPVKLTKVDQIDQKPPRQTPVARRGNETWSLV